ncbi:MAG: ribosome biogenesis GTPase Der, partial [Oscillospiraceae bacterium]|nr:ribosome biogenesis GTPase Der [Oscillospiraceae bacterium]
MKPIIAIVGRPNVGKSTLFNKLAGKRIAIVDDMPGVTRDRMYYDVEWAGRNMMLVDTGGIEPVTDDVILKHMRMQAQIAIDTADVILFITDVRAGLTADDKDIATMLLKSMKPVIVCVNKVDNIGDVPLEFYEFYELGFEEEPIAVSSLHGTGSGDILDKVIEYLPKNDIEEAEDDTIKVCVIGKPNSGKSSIINYILGEDRMIVSDIPGTTRDSIDTPFENELGKYVMIDTAGIRRQSKI